MFKIDNTSFEPSSIDEVKEVKPWPQTNPINQNLVKDELLKKLFGIELAKNPENPFEAALKIYEDTNQALWVSRNWLLDPIVIENRDSYLENLNLSKAFLDKEQLADKILKLAEEKTPDGKWYINRAKDRIAALKLYSDIAGYTGKVDIDTSSKVFHNNSITLKFVKPDKENIIKTIDNAPNNKLENLNKDQSPIKLKLIG